MADENFLKTILGNKILRNLLYFLVFALSVFFLALAYVVFTKSINKQDVKKIGPVEFYEPHDSNKVNRSSNITNLQKTSEKISFIGTPQPNNSSNNLKSSTVSLIGNITGKNIVAGTNNGNVGDQTYNINTFQRKLNDTMQSELLDYIGFYLAQYNKNLNNYPITLSIMLNPGTTETKVFAEDIYNILTSKGFNVKIVERENNISPIPVGWRFDFSKDGLDISLYNYSDKIKKPSLCGRYDSFYETGQ